MPASDMYPRRYVVDDRIILLYDHTIVLALLTLCVLLKFPLEGSMFGQLTVCNNIYMSTDTKHGVINVSMRRGNNHSWSSH